jgi:hypothetical protein
MSGELLADVSGGLSMPFVEMNTSSIAAQGVVVGAVGNATGVFTAL